MDQNQWNRLHMIKTALMDIDEFIMVEALAEANTRIGKDQVRQENDVLAISGDVVNGSSCPVQEEPELQEQGRRSPCRSL